MHREHPVPDRDRPPSVAAPRLLGLILAGGRATRMEGSVKALLNVAERPILSRIVGAISPQCSELALNINDSPTGFADFGLPIIPDTIDGFVGPLAGLLAGLDWAFSHRPEVRNILSVPGDCPFLPNDLVRRLDEARQREGKPIACARSGGQIHPVIALWPVTIRHALREALCEKGLRSVNAFAAQIGVAAADWSDRPVDPFFNINTSDDLSKANLLAKTVDAARQADYQTERAP